MRHTHGFQNQAALANEVTTSTEPGTSSRQQAEASPKNHRNPKIRRGSDNEYTEPTTTMTPLGDIDTLKDTSTSWPDTTRCIPVGRETNPQDFTNLNQQHQTSLDTEHTGTQQRGHTHHISQKLSVCSTFRKRQTNHALDTIPVSTHNDHTPRRQSRSW